MKYFSMLGKLVSAKGNSKGVSVGIEYEVTKPDGSKTSRVDYVGVFKPELISQLHSFKEGEVLYINGVCGVQKVVSKSAIDINTNKPCEYWKESNIATKISSYKSKQNFNIQGVVSPEKEESFNKICKELFNEKTTGPVKKLKIDGEERPDNGSLDYLQY